MMTDPTRSDRKNHDAIMSEIAEIEKNYIALKAGVKEQYDIRCGHEHEAAAVGEENDRLTARVEALQKKLHWSPAEVRLALAALANVHALDEGPLGKAWGIVYYRLSALEAENLAGEDAVADLATVGSFARELQKQLKTRTRELELSRENAEAWKVEAIKWRKMSTDAAATNVKIYHDRRRLGTIAEHRRGRLKEAQKNPSPESVAMLMQHMMNQYQELLELGDDTIKDIIDLHRGPR